MQFEFMKMDIKAHDEKPKKKTGKSKKKKVKSTI